MRTDTISEIGIDNQNSLFIRPANEIFPLIYRTATEVHWDSNGKLLYSPKPREWSYLDWYAHILNVVRNEANIDLKLYERTKWTNIPDDLKIDIIKSKTTFEDELRTVSWIFLSVALATQENSVTISEISMIADGINHAVPTHKEVQYSMNWLISKNLISKESNKYRLTEKGQKEYEMASANTKKIFNIWKNLEQRIKNRA